MKPCELVWCWWIFAGVALGVPGLWRRQATTIDSCTCPANGPVTATLVQYTIVTSTTTSFTDGGTITNEGSISTSTVTVENDATVTVTTDTVSVTNPAVTSTITQQSTVTSTITSAAIVTTCTVSANPKIRRQNTDPSVTTTDGTVTDGRPTVTFTSTISSRLVTCTCSPRPQTTTLAGTSSCSCPATTATTVTTTSYYTGTAMVIYISPTQSTITTTPTVTFTSTTQVTITSGAEATTEVTASPSTVTLQSTSTVFETVTSTSIVNKCPSSSSTIQSSSSTVSSAIGPTSSAPGTFACNSTAYFIDTVNSKVNFYNIDLNSGKTFIINDNLGGTAYTNINGMGFNPLDNFLYAIATTTTSGTYAVVRVEISNTATEILRFTASATPGNIGDVDTNGQFWFSGGGTTWYHVDLAPGSSTFGTMIGSGTMTLPTNYAVADWSYLPGQGNYLWTLARQTASNYLSLLRWSMTDHTWSISQTFTNYAAPYTIIATWGSNNNTLWAYSATSGTITQYDFGSQPYLLSNGLTAITNGDGARCGLTP